jgi:23S rRNA (uracil1939-C5)-methyltransferase
MDIQKPALKPAFKKGDLVELTISDLAFGGAGVAKIEGYAVFVEGTIPGDKVSARLTRVKSQFGEAVVVSMSTPSPMRISARCKHFGVCGGCALQSLKYEDQLKLKEKFIYDAITRIGGFRDAKIEPIIGCESPWFYRNKMDYSFAADNRDGSTGDKLGLHYKTSFKNVFDLEECFLQSELSVEILHATKKWAKEKEWPFFKTFSYDSSLSGLRNLVIRDGKNTGEVMVNLIASGVRQMEKTERLKNEFRDFITTSFPKITSVYLTEVIVQKGHRTVTREHLLSGKAAITETLNVANTKLHFDIHPQAFFQTNSKQTELLYGKILELADARPEDRVADLFCGTGTIGMFFAANGCETIGIELNASAIENAKKNAETNGIKNIKFLCGDVAKYLANDSETSKATIIITDPPRAGMTPTSLEKIIAFRAPKWVYVSCNPTTLSRDLQAICASGYKLRKIQPVDMFPHTYHVETICLLTR